MTQPPRCTTALLVPFLLLMACGDGFNGHWVGTYNGTFTYADTTRGTREYVNEFMDFSILDGTITGLSPVDATGTLTESGAGSWAPTDSKFTPFKFTGTFSGTTASGTWSYTLAAPQAGSASGTWSAALKTP